MAIGVYPGITVYTKAAWADPWTARTTLEAISAVKSCAPEKPVATIRQHYGMKKVETSNTFAAETPLNLVDHYVKIQSADTTLTWVGIIVEYEDEHLGTDANNPTGVRTFTAYGLEHVLDMRPIYGANVVDTGVIKFVHQSPTFNARHKRSGALEGNRAEAKIAGEWAFSEEDLYPNKWTTYNILEYILSHYLPTGWVLGGQAEDLDQEEPVVQLDGLSVFQALNKLIDRRRGYSWCVRSTGAGDNTIHIFSLFDTDISTTEFVFYANTEMATCDFGNMWVVQAAHTAKSRERFYDTVRVQGKRIVACFSASYDDPFVFDADATEQAAYLAAASGATGYSALTDQEKRDLNEAVRADPQFREVFARLAIPLTWDFTEQYAGRAVNLSITGDEEFALNGQLSLTTGQIYRHGRAILQKLPLPDGVDCGAAGWYNSENLASQPLRVPTVWLTASGILDGPRPVNDLHSDAIPNATVAPSDRGTAIICRFKPNHLIAPIGDWTDAAPDNIEPILDPYYLRFTVAIELDERLVVEKRISANDHADMRRTIVIPVDDAEMWFVMAGTIVGVDGDLYRRVYLPPTDSRTLKLGDTPVAFVIRDDGPRLRSICLVAAAWYGVERSAVRFAINNLHEYKEPGNFITTATAGTQSWTINAPVTKTTFNFVDGSMTLQTSWWDVDWQRIAPANVPGFNDMPSVTRAMTRNVADLLELAQDSD